MYREKLLEEISRDEKHRNLIAELNKKEVKKFAMSFEEELKELISKWLPEKVTICTGRVTYRQTLETPEEYEEIEVDLDADAFMEYYSEDIDNLICIINDAESCEFVEKMEADWEEPSPY